MGETSERPRPARAETLEVVKRILRHENAVLIFVLIGLIGVMGGITKGLTLSAVNMGNILLQSATRGVAAVGQTFVILTAGIDLSVGGVALFCSILGSQLMTSTPHLNIVGHPVPIALGILVMMLLGTGWGIINGLSVSRIGIPPLIVTLAMWEITAGAAFQLTSGEPIGHLPENLSPIGVGRVAGVPVLVIIFIAVAVVAYFVLEHTTFGRSVYAVGGNPVSAYLSGINVKNVLLMVYVIAGFLVGLAAALYTAKVMSASMRSAMGLELDSIAASVIGGISLMGGRGSIIGVVIGVIILGVINNGMSVMGAGPDVQGIAKGAIIFTAVTIDYLRRRR